MICAICKTKNATHEAAGAMICDECVGKLRNHILMVCQRCNSMSFLPKTPDNIMRLLFFLPMSVEDFILSEVIVPTNGCPACMRGAVWAVEPILQ